MLAAVLFGLTFGFLGSVPIAGPISALVFRCGLAGLTKRGLGISLGAALAEGLYAYLAFWGVGSVFASYPWLLPICRLLGGLILVGLGISFFRRPEPGKPTEEAPTPKDRTGKSSIPLGFGLTIINPTLIATWSAVVATAFSTTLVSYSPAGALGFAGGVTLGIVLWFFLMLELLARFRDRLGPRSLRRAIQGIGATMVALGLWFLASAVREAYLVEPPAEAPAVSAASAEPGPERAR